MPYRYAAGPMQCGGHRLNPIPQPQFLPLWLDSGCYYLIRFTPLLPCCSLPPPAGFPTPTNKFPSCKSLHVVTRSLPCCPLPLSPGPPTPVNEFPSCHSLSCSTPTPSLAASWPHLRVLPHGGRVVDVVHADHHVLPHRHLWAAAGGGAVRYALATCLQVYNANAPG